MPPAGLKPAIPASKPLQTNAWDRASTEIGNVKIYEYKIFFCEIIFIYNCMRKFEKKKHTDCQIYSQVL
jgi:hypothetical protein